MNLFMDGYSYIQCQEYGEWIYERKRATTLGRSGMVYFGSIFYDDMDVDVYMEII